MGRNWLLQVHRVRIWHGLYTESLVFPDKTAAYGKNCNSRAAKCPALPSLSFCVPRHFMPAGMPRSKVVRINVCKWRPSPSGTCPLPHWRCSLHRPGRGSLAVVDLGGRVSFWVSDLFLIGSYKLGDLSQVYPIARASAPVMATIFGALVLGDRLAPFELIGIAIIATGLLSTVGLRIQNVPHKAALTALITGMFIASYSMSDGYGGRLGNSPIAFYGWLSLINGVLMAIYLRSTSPDSVPLLWTKSRLTLIGGGFASFCAYSLVMWAFTQAPIPVVMAIRESSILIAFGIGVVFWAKTDPRQIDRHYGHNYWHHHLAVRRIIGH